MNRVSRRSSPSLRSTGFLYVRFIHCLQVVVLIVDAALLTQKQFLLMPAQLRPVKLHCVALVWVVFVAVNTIGEVDGAVGGVKATEPLLIWRLSAE